MAVVHGKPGEWARVKGSVTGLWPVFACIAMAGFAVGMAVFRFFAAGAILFAASLLAVKAAMSYAYRRIENHMKGARGEERVSAILKTLPDSYHVFNDFNACGFHVDHVVVGPAGVYSIETKNWQGKVTLEDGCLLVDGKMPSRSPGLQAAQEASLVKRALSKLGWSGEVTPVLTFASGNFVPEMAEIDGLVVMNAKQLRPAFGAQRVVLPTHEINRLVTLMENME